jgi:hypothetical protein
VFRGSADTYTMKLSAKHSVDTEKRPLVYRWVLLQGDPGKVSIIPSEDGSEATLQVRWHPPFYTASGLRTHRVDIGLFARSPLATSAPAFISIAMLPNEMRFFKDDGRLDQICYQAGNPEPGFPSADTDLRWLSFVQTVAAKPATAASKLLAKVLSPPQREAFARAWDSVAGLKAALDNMAADPARKDDMDKQSAALGKSLATILSTVAKDSAGKPRTLRQAAIASVTDLAASSGLFLDLQDVLFDLAANSPVPTAQADLRAELKRLTDLGVLMEDAGARFRLASGRSVPAGADLYYLKQLHLTVLSQILLPGFLHRSPAPLYVDPRLGTVKAWRDIYRYDDAGKRSGWVRHFQGRLYRFDQDGRCLDAGDQPKPVAYRVESGHVVFDPPAK